ncbi:MAG: hypothetical protein ACREH3_12125 [Geminicoccales bacterium]
MSWYGFIRKYVWNEQKTPYLVPVPTLSRAQARNELFSFSVLTAAFFFVIGLLSLLGVGFLAGSPGIALYSFGLCSSAIALGATRHQAAALTCATAPPVLLAYLLVYGFPPSLHLPDKLLIGAVALLLGLYAFRVVAIARAYRSLHDDEHGG